MIVRFPHRSVKFENCCFWSCCWSSSSWTLALLHNLTTRWRCEFTYLCYILVNSPNMLDLYEFTHLCLHFVNSHNYVTLSAVRFLWNRTLLWNDTLYVGFWNVKSRDHALKNIFSLVNRSLSFRNASLLKKTMQVSQLTQIHYTSNLHIQSTFLKQ